MNNSKLFDQLFIVQCKNCKSVVADSAMLLIMDIEFGVFNDVNKNGIQQVKETEMFICKCSYPIGRILFASNQISFRIYWTNVTMHICGFNKRRHIKKLNGKIPIKITTNKSS